MDVYYEYLIVVNFFLILAYFALKCERYPEEGSGIGSDDELLGHL